MISAIGVCGIAGYLMSALTYEIFRDPETPLFAGVLRLSDKRTIWCQVEALALRVKSNNGSFIRVKNRRGETVIQAGIATALASIESCSCPICPLKKELVNRGPVGGYAAIEFGAHFFPCEGEGGSYCNVDGLYESSRVQTLNQ
jgi:hypothetical protein